MWYAYLRAQHPLVFSNILALVPALSASQHNLFEALKHTGYSAEWHVWKVKALVSCRNKLSIYVHVNFT